MAATNSKFKTIAYSYGLGGGPLHSRGFSRQLADNGYQLVKDMSSADIILAHSAGCWLLPNDARPKLVIYVGMPFAEDKTYRKFLSSQVNMLKAEAIVKSIGVRFRTTYYFLVQPRFNLHIIRMAKTASPVVFKNAQSVFISNRYDPWPKGDQVKDYLVSKDWAFISLGGDHDDIWQHPGDYINIINHYVRLLAKTN